MKQGAPVIEGIVDDIGKALEYDDYIKNSQHEESSDSYASRRGSRRHSAWRPSQEQVLSKFNSPPGSNRRVVAKNETVTETDIRVPQDDDED